MTERSRLDYESNVFLHRPGAWVSWTVASTYFQDQRTVRVSDGGTANGFQPPFGPYESARTVSLPIRVIASGPLLAFPLPFIGDNVSIAVGGDFEYDLAMNLSAPRDGFVLGPPSFPGDDPTAVPPRQANRISFQPLIALPIQIQRGGVSIFAQAGARAEAAQTLLGSSAYRVLPFVAVDGRVEIGRTFRTPGGRLRHAIRPEVSLLYVPNTFFSGDENVASVFGPDAPLEGWTVQVSLVNNLLYRTVVNGRRGAARQILAMRIGQRFDSDVTRSGVPFANIRAGFPGFSVTATATMNSTASSLEKASVFLGTGGRGSPGGIGASYSYGRDPDVDQISANLWVVPGRMFPTQGGIGRALKRLRLEGVTRYDLNEELASRRQLSIGGGFSYVSPCQCWSISASVTKDRDRDRLGFTFRFEPTVPRSAKRMQPLVAGRERD